MRCWVSPSFMNSEKMNIIENNFTDSVGLIGKYIMEHEAALKLNFNQGNQIGLPSDFSAVIYLNEGSAGLYYNENGCLISDMYAPAVIGLTYLFFSNHDMNITFKAKSSVYYINQNDFIKMCDQKQLWRNVSHIIAKTERKLNSNPTLSMYRSAYDIVRFYIESIWTLPEQEREKISVYQYIQERSRLSRSSLHKIIKDLNVGGYIKTERGRLMDVQRLPVKY